MTDLQFHELTKEKGAARVVLNRPKHNVFNIDMMLELTALLAELDTDADLKCVVITGKGASWCAGVEVGDHKPELAPEMIRVFDALLRQIHAMKIPTMNNSEMNAGNVTMKGAGADASSTSITNKRPSP